MSNVMFMLGDLLPPALRVSVWECGSKSHGITRSARRRTWAHGQTWDYLTPWDVAGGAGALTLADVDLFGPLTFVAMIPVRI